MTWQAYEMDARREGREEGRKKDIEYMLRNGKTVRQISDFCGYAQSEIEAVRRSMNTIPAIKQEKIRYFSRLDQAADR